MNLVFRLFVEGIMPKITDPDFPLASSIQSNDKVLGVVGGEVKLIPISMLSDFFGNTATPAQIVSSLNEGGESEALQDYEGWISNESGLNPLRFTINGVLEQRSVDLSSANSLSDVASIIENAFDGLITVALLPAANDTIQFAISTVQTGATASIATVTDTLLTSFLAMPGASDNGED